MFRKDSVVSAVHLHTHGAQREPTVQRPTEASRRARERRGPAHLRTIRASPPPWKEERSEYRTCCPRPACDLPTYALCAACTGVPHLPSTLREAADRSASRDQMCCRRPEWLAAIGVSPVAGGHTPSRDTLLFQLSLAPPVSRPLHETRAIFAAVHGQRISPRRHPHSPARRPPADAAFAIRTRLSVYLINQHRTPISSRVRGKTSGAEACNL